MAALIGPIVGELGALLGGSGIGATLARGALTGVGSIAALDLLKALQADLSPGASAQAKSNARKVPQFAIVDLHSNKTVRFLSTRHVYSILTHPSRRNRRGRNTTRIITVPSGSRIEREVTIK